MSVYPVLISTGERPNKCCHPGCTYSTSDPGSLTRHRRSAHAYEPKAKKSNRSVDTARKEPRRNRRPSPYFASSPSSSEGSVSSCSTNIDDQLPELQGLLEAPSCSAAEPYPVVAAKYTYPAYDTELSSRTVLCNDPMVYPSLLECTTETSFQQAEHASLVPCPQVLMVPQQEAPYFAPCYLNSLDSWMPSPLPPLPSSDNILFIDAGSYESANTFQCDFPQFQQVDSQGIGHQEHFPHGTFPSSGLTGDFNHSGQFYYASFSASDGLSVGATDLFTQFSLAC